MSASWTCLIIIWCPRWIRAQFLAPLLRGRSQIQLFERKFDPNFPCLLPFGPCFEFEVHPENRPLDAKDGLKFQVGLDEVTSLRRPTFLVVSRKRLTFRYRIHPDCQPFAFLSEETRVAELPCASWMYDFTSHHQPIRIVILKFPVRELVLEDSHFKCLTVLARQLHFCIGCRFGPMRSRQHRTIDTVNRLEVEERISEKSSSAGAADVLAKA
jgi:hypothetical protein